LIATLKRLKQAASSPLLGIELCAPIAFSEFKMFLGPERRHMRARGIIRRDGLCHEIWALRLDAGIDMLAVIAVGPAVEGAILHGCHVVGHEVGTDLVAFVDDRPGRPLVGLKVRPFGLPKPLAKIR
jgi:hypothetical protein